MKEKNNLPAVVNIGDPGNDQQQPKATVKTMESFLAMLNEAPDPKEIKVNKAAGGSKYLPISFVQMKLDELFLGLWETEDYRYTVVANEIVGNIVLKVYHPIAKVWLRRTGSAAVMIMQKSGAEVMDISSKIKNTLAKDFPHLEAACLTSAARKLGKCFGRDVNRKEEDNYSTFYTDIAESDEVLKTIDWTKVTDLAKLTATWKAYPDLHANPNFIKQFTYQRSKLTA